MLKSVNLAALPQTENIAGKARPMLRNIVIDGVSDDSRARPLLRGHNFRQLCNLSVG